MHPAEAKALELDNVAHSKKPGMVWQVWQDGEITLQKSGDLLWQRNLHMIVPPVHGLANPKALQFPHASTEGNSFAWVASEEEAKTVRDLIT